MKKINYKSDFDFLLKLKDSQGNDIGWPQYDWTATFWTSSKANSMTASCIGGKCTNCYNDNDRIHIVINSPKLGIGVLKVEFAAHLPNDIYPDMDERIVIPLPLDIELIRDAAPCPEGFEVEVMLPYIKGEPFTYEDFTEKQIAELQRPATEAAQRADQATSAAQTATSNAVSATEDAQKATTDMRSLETTVSTQEQSRVNAESSRVSAESGRVTAENGRVLAETDREQSESNRRVNETSRLQAEGARKTAEDRRDNAETLRANAETQRANAESTRQANEASRQAAEQGRVAAEAKRVEAETLRQTQFATAKTNAETATEQANQAATYTRGVGEGYADAVEEAKFKVFIDLWNKACGMYGKYNSATGYFELNGLTDIDYEEAQKIYTVSIKGLGISANNLIGVYSKGALYNTRTVFPIYLGAGDTRLELQGAFQYNNVIEVIRFVINASNNAINSVNYCFYNCSNLRHIYGELISERVTFDKSAFNSCKKLETVFIKNVAKNVFFDDSPLISAESLNYLINSKNNTNSITISVHSTTYAKLTDTSNTEWHKILTDAAAKNISFATV